MRGAQDGRGDPVVPKVNNPMMVRQSGGKLRETADFCRSKVAIAGHLNKYKIAITGHLNIY